MGADAIKAVGVWAALMLLLALSDAASFAPIGPFRLAASLAIAAAKASLIYWFYMHLRELKGIARLAAVGAIAWLLILILLTGFDFAVRVHLPAQGS